jgi:hypothetical protein
MRTACLKFCREPILLSTISGLLPPPYAIIIKEENNERSIRLEMPGFTTVQKVPCENLQGQQLDLRHGTPKRKLCNHLLLSMIPRHYWIDPETKLSTQSKFPSDLQPATEEWAGFVKILRQSCDDVTYRFSTDIFQTYFREPSPECEVRLGFCYSSLFAVG